MSARTTGRGSGGMKTIARGSSVLLLAALACGSACARSDWIEQTLVTVDVTGTWQSTEGPLFELELEQQGPKVKGVVRIQGFEFGNSMSGPIDPTFRRSRPTFLPPLAGLTSGVHEPLRGDPEEGEELTLKLG